MPRGSLLNVSDCSNTMEDKNVHSSSSFQLMQLFICTVYFTLITWVYMLSFVFQVNKVRCKSPKFTIK